MRVDVTVVLSSDAEEIQVELEAEVDVRVTSREPAEAQTREHPGSGAEIQIEARLCSDIRVGDVCVLRAGHRLALSPAEAESIVEQMSGG